MSTGPSSDPLMQQLQLLLTGYGYNFYGVANQARADDLLVRERASYHLAHAVDSLTSLRTAYQRRYMPPLTRENPYPSAEALASLREMQDVQQTISDVESHIRGMSVPAQDRIWWHFRQEHMLLNQLLYYDLSLVRGCEQVYDYVAQFTPENWNAQVATSLRQLIQQITQIANDRERFLLRPV